MLKDMMQNATSAIVSGFKTLGTALTTNTESKNYSYDSASYTDDSGADTYNTCFNLAMKNENGLPGIEYGKVIVPATTSDVSEAIHQAKKRAIQLGGTTVLCNNQPDWKPSYEAFVTQCDGPNFFIQGANDSSFPLVKDLKNDCRWNEQVKPGIILAGVLAGLPVFVCCLAACMAKTCPSDPAVIQGEADDDNTLELGNTIPCKENDASNKKLGNRTP